MTWCTTDRKDVGWRTSASRTLVLFGLLVVAGVSCSRQQGNRTQPTEGAGPTSVSTMLASPVVIGALLPGTSIPFRVDFDLISGGARQGTVAWRQSLGARRLDFSVLAPEPHGGFEIESNFSDKGVPRDGVACNWVMRDASLVNVNCGVALDAGGLASDLISTASIGFADRQLPPRSVLGINARCLGINSTALGLSGEICLEPDRQIPLYYANGSGDVLIATSFALDTESSAFASDLVTRTPILSGGLVSRDALELPQ